MNIKKCCKCKQLKPYSDFYKNKSRNDGLQSYCKVCQKKYNHTAIGKLVRKKANKKYQPSINGIKASKKYYKNNPKKVKAVSFINNLFKISDFTRDICSICGKPNAEFHHENYDLPYFGYWFCKEHHTEIHKEV